MRFQITIDCTRPTKICCASGWPFLLVEDSKVVASLISYSSISFAASCTQPLNQRVGKAQKLCTNLICTVFSDAVKVGSKLALSIMRGCGQYCWRWTAPYLASSRSFHSSLRPVRPPVVCKDVMRWFGREWLHVRLRES